MKFLKRMMAMCLCGMLLFCFCIPAAHAEETEEQITNSEKGDTPKANVFSETEDQSAEETTPAALDEPTAYEETVEKVTILCFIYDRSDSLIEGGGINDSFEVEVEKSQPLVTQLEEYFLNENGYTIEEWYFGFTIPVVKNPIDENYKNQSDNMQVCGVISCSHDSGYTEKVTKEATCKEEGEITCTCKLECGYSYKKTIPVSDVHTLDRGVVTTEATCTEAGVLTYTCTVCQKTQEEKIAPTGHTWDEGKVTTAATCVEAGVLTYTCTVCGETKTEEIPAAGHTWNDGVVTKAATCVKEGVKTYTCTVCGETKTETIPATGNHTYENGVCTVCGAIEPVDSGASSSASSSSSSSSSSSHSSDSSSSSDDAVYSPGRLLNANGISNLSISVYSTSIPTDLASYDQALDGGSYIGFYRVDTYVGGVLTQTLPNAIRVTVDIPAQYLAAGRNFYMLAIQDGKTVVLSDLDAIEGTITFDASQFGNIFALVYKDGTIATALTSAATLDSPRTGDDTVVLPYVLLALVSAACAGVITKKYLILGKSAKV